MRKKFESIMDTILYSQLTEMIMFGVLGAITGFLLSVAPFQVILFLFIYVTIVKIFGG